MNIFWNRKNRRQFLQAAGTTIAGLYARKHTSMLALAAPYALQMNAQGVVYGGAFLQTPVSNGGLAILHNLQTIMGECGFECGINGWLPFRSLEEQSTLVESGVWWFHGRLPKTNAWLHQQIRLENNAIQYSLTMDGTVDIATIQWAAFAFRLPTPLFTGRSYRVGALAGMYPLTKPTANPLANNFTSFESCTDVPGMNHRIDSSEPMRLYDGRVWNEAVYKLSIPFPLDKCSLNFTLTPDPVDPGPSSPALRWSQAGYSPRGEKLALLEIDWRDAWPADMTVRLERQTSSGSEVALQGSFVAALDEYWKRFAIFDFSVMEIPGVYRVVWAGGASGWFPINGNIYAPLWHPVLDSFFPFQMCHVNVDLGDGLRAHGACHMDDGVQVQPNKIGPDSFISYQDGAGPGPGQPIPCAEGGWHDAGDYDLNVSAQAYVTHLLALAWEQFAPSRDVNSLDTDNRTLRIGVPNGKPDLLEQLVWGARWLLTMQQESDGRVYAGVVEKAGIYGKAVPPDQITDRLPNTGDEREVYVDVHSDVQLKFIAAVAAASRALAGYDAVLAGQCRDAALRAWDYFQTHDPIYRNTVYFRLLSGCEGWKQMVMCAAAELYLTDSDPLRAPTYLAALAALEPYLRNWPVSWPEPSITTYLNYWYAAPFLARLLPKLAAGSLKDAVTFAVNRAINMYSYRLNRQPFTLYPTEFGRWGNNHRVLARIYDTYWLWRAMPERISLQSALPSLYWMLGLHPVNNLAFFFGAGLPEPHYQFSATLLHHFADRRASIPGAVVPGISLYERSGILDYRDWPGDLYCNEACIYDAAMLLFDLLAVDDFEKQRAPSTAANLIDFSAAKTPAGIEICWQTMNETGLLGFNLYRQTRPPLFAAWPLGAEQPGREKLTPALITARFAGQPVGSVYTFIDANPTGTFYWLEQITVNGSVWVGPITAREESRQFLPFAPR